MSSNSSNGRRSGRALAKLQTQQMNADVAAEDSPLLAPGTMTLNYNSDSAVYDLEARDRTLCDVCAVL